MSVLLTCAHASGRRRWTQHREAAAVAAHKFARAVHDAAQARLPTQAEGCPCADSSLCLPIAGSPLAEREIFGFIGGNGSTIDWSRVTTVAWAAPDDYALMCRAHAMGARVILSAPKPELVLTSNSTARAEWVSTAVAAVTASYHDGIVFDWESPCRVGSPMQYWYGVLIGETRAALRSVHAGYQVSTCVAWSPDNIDGRGYNVGAFSRSSDALYVMDYDTRSQVIDACIAGANAPFGGTVRGISRFLDLGVPASQLILGVPWYGYRYPCLEGTTPDARFCPIKEVPFRGVNCSDAAGSEVGYKEILVRLRTMNATTNPSWDSNQGAPYFNSLETIQERSSETLDHSGRASPTGTAIGVVQYWYDDAQSLAPKYAYARSVGLRGVGPYTFTDVDSKDDVMYKALDSFLLPHAGERVPLAKAKESEA